MDHLFSPETIVILNELRINSHDFAVRYAETPTLGELYLRQLLRKEAELLKAMTELQEAYRHAHTLRLQAEPNSEVDSLLNINGIKKPK